MELSHKLPPEGTPAPSISQVLSPITTLIRTACSTGDWQLQKALDWEEEWNEDTLQFGKAQALLSSTTTSLLTMTMLVSTVDEKIASVEIKFVHSKENFQEFRTQADSTRQSACDQVSYYIPELLKVQDRFVDYLTKYKQVITLPEKEQILLELENLYQTIQAQEPTVAAKVDSQKSYENLQTSSKIATPETINNQGTLPEQVTPTPAQSPSNFTVPERIHPISDMRDSLHYSTEKQKNGNEPVVSRYSNTNQIQVQSRQVIRPPFNNRYPQEKIPAASETMQRIGLVPTQLRENCDLCRKNHLLAECDQPQELIRRFCAMSNRCIRCTSRTHLVKDCPEFENYSFQMHSRNAIKTSPACYSYPVVSSSEKEVSIQNNSEIIEHQRIEPHNSIIGTSNSHTETKTSSSTQGNESLKNAMRLLPKFSGDHLQYPKYKRAIESLVLNNSSLSSTAKRILLEQSLLDGARVYIADIADPDTAIKLTIEELENKFEDIPDYFHLRMQLDDLSLCNPNISSQAQALVQASHIIAQMEEMGAQLDHMNIGRIIGKLPYPVQVKCIPQWKKHNISVQQVIQLAKDMNSTSKTSSILRKEFHPGTAQPTDKPVAIPPYNQTKTPEISQRRKQNLLLALRKVSRIFRTLVEQQEPTYNYIGLFINLKICKLNLDGTIICYRRTRRQTCLVGTKRRVVEKDPMDAMFDDLLPIMSHPRFILKHLEVTFTDFPSYCQLDNHPLAPSNICVEKLSVNLQRKQGCILFDWIKQDFVKEVIANYFQKHENEMRYYKVRNVHNESRIDSHVNYKTLPEGTGKWMHKKFVCIAK